MLLHGPAERAAWQGLAVGWAERVRRNNWCYVGFRDYDPPPSGSADLAPDAGCCSIAIQRGPVAGALFADVGLVSDPTIIEVYGEQLMWKNAGSGGQTRTLCTRCWPTRGWCGAWSWCAQSCARCSWSGTLATPAGCANFQNRFRRCGGNTRGARVPCRCRWSSPTPPNDVDAGPARQHSAGAAAHVS